LSAIISRATGTGIGRAGAGRVRQHDVALERGEIGRRNVDRGELSEAGVDAVDGSPLATIADTAAAERSIAGRQFRSRVGAAPL
jgi:hypothetical protein